MSALGSPWVVKAGTFLGRGILPSYAPQRFPASTLGPPLTPTLAGGLGRLVAVAVDGGDAAEARVSRQQSLRHVEASVHPQDPPD